jgi:hypothetical protein
VHSYRASPGRTRPWQELTPASPLRGAEVQWPLPGPCSVHVPIVWATQVLDQLARTGRPTRAEITDAVILLDDVLTRMADRQRKNAPLLDELRWAADTGETAEV